MYAEYATGAVYAAAMGAVYAAATGAVYAAATGAVYATGSSGLAAARARKQAKTNCNQINTLLENMFKNNILKIV